MTASQNETPDPSRAAGDTAETYRISKLWRVLIFIGAPLLICLFVWVGMLPFQEDRTDGIYATIFLVSLAVGMSTLLVLGFLSAIKTRLIIAGDTIRLIELFKDRSLHTSEIQGFRQVPGHFLILVPKDKTKKKIKISVYFEEIDEIIIWAHNNLADMDATEFAQEEAAILQDYEHGRTEEARGARLESARKWTGFVNILATGAALWGFVYPQPYNLVIVLLGLLPVLAILTIAYYGGLVRLDGKTDSAHPNVALAFMLPTGVLALRAFLDWHILETENLWPAASSVSVVVLVAVLLVDKEARKKLANIFLLLPFAFFYGYGATVQANGLLDDSQPVTYEMTVVDKRISKGKRNTYYLTLGKGKLWEEEKEVSVSKNLFRRKKNGDIAFIQVKQGKVAIPWYEIY